MTMTYLSLKIFLPVIVKILGFVTHTINISLVVTCESLPTRNFVSYYRKVQTTENLKR